MKKFSLLLLFVFISCDAILNPVANLDEPFWLEFGQVKVLPPDNLRIEFRQLLEESRCPSDVICVWEGRARIGLLLQTPADSIQVELLLPGFATQADTLAHQPVDTLGYRMTLMQLDPYPNTQRRPQNSDYKALLKISRLLRR